MEKKIKLVMDSSKDIHIFVNETERHVITNTSRQISAKLIFDRYEIFSENVDEKDTEVLKFFVDLLEDITNKIQAIKLDDSISENDDA